jgi:hypothetical protein
MRLIKEGSSSICNVGSRGTVALDYADAKDRRRPTPEIDWYGEMIGGSKTTVVWVPVLDLSDRLDLAEGWVEAIA